MLHVSDLPVGEDITVLSDPEAAVATVSVVREEAAEAIAPETDAVEPEVRSGLVGAVERAVGDEQQPLPGLYSYITSVATTIFQTGQSSRPFVTKFRTSGETIDSP